MEEFAFSHPQQLTVSHLEKQDAWSQAIACLSALHPDSSHNCTRPAPRFAVVHCCVREKNWRHSAKSE